jgi:DNA helicase-2/ATP-dependent DNA helicase PcrA
MGAIVIRSIHPEHGYESEALDETVTEIEKSVSDISSSPTGGVDSYGDEAVSEVLGEMLAAQQESLEHGPYFARVDYREDGEEAGTIYIGRHGFDSKNRRIVSWASDRGRLIYRDSRGEQVIDTPGGKVKLRLLLQRNFEIENLELRNLFDKVDRRDGSTVTLAANAQQAYLLRQLYSRGDRRLRDIVETIQQEQDGLIRAPADAPLIINGVAGSGKTSIGYHRLAYLLSPENELNLGLDASRALVLGPNAYFMAYASSVLPGLSLQGIRHTTYDEWAMRSMDFVVDGKDGRRLYRIHDGTLGKLLSPQSRPQEIDSYVRRSRLKGQLKFASVIERLAESARELGSSPTIQLAGQKRAKSVTLSPADWDAHYARAVSSRTSVSGQ